MRRPTFLFLLFASSLTALWLRRSRPRTTRRRSSGRGRDARPVGHRGVVARSRDECLHRLLPVRLRRVDGRQPDAGRSTALGTIQSAAGGQLRHPASDSGEPPPATPTSAKASDYYAACMDEARSRRSGTEPLEAELDAHRGADEQGRSAGARRASAHSIGVNALFRFGSRTDLRGRDDANRQHRSGRAGAARPRLLL